MCRREHYDSGMSVFAYTDRVITRGCPGGLGIIIQKVNSMRNLLYEIRCANSADKDSVN